MMFMREVAISIKATVNVLVPSSQHNIHLSDPFFLCPPLFLLCFSDIFISEMASIS